MPPTIGVGIIGLGFMGARHLDACLAATADDLPCRLRCVCDSDVARWSAMPAAANHPHVAFHATPQSLLADPAIQLVSICTYTDTHVELARAALAAGKHVLVEKPVALTAEGVRPLADAAAKAGTLCMPAMCIRFWPGWDWLKHHITNSTYGNVRSATFQRLGPPPAWASHFYADHTRSGGALVDLHIHDADFIYWCFGMPAEVSTHGTLAHLTTTYCFPNGPSHVTAEGGWSLHPKVGFRMRFLVAFENATADYDSTRSPVPLLLHDDTGSNPVQLAAGTGYDHEMRSFVKAISSGSRTPPCSMQDALAVATLLDAERQSLIDGKPARL